MTRMTNREALAKVCDEMDKAQEMFEILYEFKKNKGFVPERFRKDYEEMEREGPWRKNPRLRARMRQTARVFARNENNKRLRVELARLNAEKNRAAAAAAPAAPAAAPAAVMQERKRFRLFDIFRRRS